MKKIIFFLIDGLADKNQQKTPLKLAKKPFMNQLNNLHLSYIYPLKKNYWPRQGNYSVSGLANLHLLGYKIKPEQFKRGPYEALGSDIVFKDGWLAFRANLATVDNKLRLIDRRAGRQIYGFQQLAKVINKLSFEIPFNFYHTSGHRGVLIFKEKLSDKISDNDPYQLGKRVKKIQPLSKDSLTLKTAELINKFNNLVYQTLKNSPLNIKRQQLGLLPANYLLLREGGNKILKLKNFFKKFGFRNGLVIATHGVDKGTCLSVGFKKFNLTYSSTIDQELTKIKKVLIEKGNNYQLIYCHLKKADEASHDKDFNKKREFFEKFDLFFKLIYNKFPQTIFVITGDHITDTKTGKHQFGPVPLIIINSYLKNNPRDISEQEALRLGEFFKDNHQLWHFLKKNVNE